jgi:hypothetical protein
LKGVHKKRSWMKGGRKEKRIRTNTGIQELEVEICEIQKRAAKKAGVQYNGVQKSRVIVRSTIYYRGEQYGRINDSM